MGSRTSDFLSSPLDSGRPGWRQGRGEAAASWSAVVDGRLVTVVRARGMFSAEMLRPEGGVFHAGEHPTLAAAQEAIERQAHLFALNAGPGELVGVVERADGSRRSRRIA